MSHMFVNIRPQGSDPEKTVISTIFNLNQKVPKRCSFLRLVEVYLKSRALSVGSAKPRITASSHYWLSVDGAQAKGLTVFTSNALNHG
jgi:hypothetical protein